MDVLNELKPRIRIGAVAYVIFVGVLYQWGYWGTFDINILQFMSVSDVIRSFLYPFLAGMFFYLIGALISYRGNRILPEGEGRETPIGRFLNKYIFVLNILFSILVLIVLIYGGPGRWFVAAAITIPLLTAMISRKEWVHAVLPDMELRRAVTFFGVAFPILAYAHGASKAEWVLKDYSYTEARIGDSNTRFKYLGHAGDYVFLMSMDNATINMRRASDIPHLLLNKKDGSTPKS